jgi:nucleoside-diphosphate-sugar epimerase
LIKELTGWQPGYSLEQGLKETIAWFINQENLKKYKTGLYNL